MINIEKYLNNFSKTTNKLSLDGMQYFMNKYNNFQNKMKFIHVAGTNGKGSYVEMVSNILIKAGYKVGKFISPHLIKYNERISINEKNISDAEMCKLITELEPIMAEYKENKKSEITLFEVITTMALLYFYRNNVDFAILETGLGGMYDCTNIISNPLISVITSIGYDHTNVLGNTLPEIAYQKAGIIKENSNTIIFEQSPEIDNVFINECNKKNNNLHIITKNKIKNYSYDDKYQYFNYENIDNISINLKGPKQVHNACICIETTKILNNLGYKIHNESIRNGLKNVIHKGRIEILNNKPLIIYDGAHNENAIENLQAEINSNYNNFKRVYIISILKTKNYKKMLELLLQDKNGTFILTSGNNEQRYVSNKELYNIAITYSKTAKIYMQTLKQAIENIKENDYNTVNFIVGSFYIYGTVKKI